MTFAQTFRCSLVALLAGLTALPLRAGFKEDIGLTALLAELGAAAPTGAGVAVTQVEGADGLGNYVADAGNSEFAGKSFTPKSGASGASSHATSVGQSFYGTVNGSAPGVTQIDAYEANNYIGAGFLRTGNPGLSPGIESRRIQNHSWVGETGNSSIDNEIVRRLDFAIHRDGFTCVVGLNNGSSTVVPPLLAHAYNVISVGVPNGDHSRGGTTFETAGRIKPELISPAAFGGVSHSVGAVSGAAALLHQVANGSAGLLNARTNSEVIKALLLAGATKAPFPTWMRTTNQPLDLVYGAGRLNIQNSYHLLVAGEHASSSSVTVTNRGWDFATTTASPAYYFINVPTGYLLTNFSVVLTWNRTPSGPPFTSPVSVADLNLRLYAATNFTLGPVLDSSVSTNQNVEHIFAGGLGAGRYALEVTSDTTGKDYALAWGGTMAAQIVTSVNQPAWGSVSPPSGFYVRDSSMQFLATPATYFLFGGWSGSLTGTNNPVPLTVTSNMSVTATFVERFTTNYPTPYWWLAAYGYTSNQETVVTNIGANGFPLWQSYIAGLNPTNSASQLRFTSQTLLHGTNLVLTWDTVTDRVYTIWASPNAASGFATLPGAVNLPPTIQSFTNPIPPATPGRFYQLEVQKP